MTRTTASVFKRVEESHSALHEFEDGERFEARSFEKNHYAPVTASARYLQLTTTFWTDVLRQEHKEISAVGLDLKQLAAVKKDRDNNAVDSDNATWFLPVRLVAALAKNKVQWDRVQ